MWPQSVAGSGAEVFAGHRSSGRLTLRHYFGDDLTCPPVLLMNWWRLFQ